MSDRVDDQTKPNADPVLGSAKGQSLALKGIIDGRCAALTRLISAAVDTCDFAAEQGLDVTGGLRFMLEAIRKAFARIVAELAATQSRLDERIRIEIDGESEE